MPPYVKHHRKTAAVINPIDFKNMNATNND